MTGVHGLQHVERFFAADLADDDAVGTHTQRVDHQLAGAHRALAFDVRRAGFQAHDVPLPQSSAPPRPRWSRCARSLPMNPDRMFSSVVLPAPVPPDTIRFIRQAIAAWRNSSIGSVHDSRPTRSSAPRRSVRNRRIDIAGPSSASGGMMALTREPSARRASTIGLDSSMRRPTLLTMRSMICIRWRSSLKTMSVSDQLAFALDVDLVVAVDQNVGDRRIAEQDLERPEPEQLVEDVGDQGFALEQAQRRRRALALDHADDQAADLGLGVLPPHPREAVKIEPVQQILMDPALQILIVAAAGIDAAAAISPVGN